MSCSRNGTGQTRRRPDSASPAHSASSESQPSVSHTTRVRPGIYRGPGPAMVSQDAQKKFGLLCSACRAWLSSQPHPTNTPGHPCPRISAPALPSTCCASLLGLPSAGPRTNITSSRRPSLTTWSPFIISSHFFTQIVLFIHLLLAVLGLCCWMGFTLVARSRGYSLIAAPLVLRSTGSEARGPQ